MNTPDSDREKYYELSYYTLAHTDPSFIHQHVVDAFAAQHADEHTKPITVAFALIGLFLYIEKNYSGKEVQNAHSQLARKRKQWPTFNPPVRRGKITVADVMKAAPGPERDRAIREWAASVWNAWSDSHEKISKLWSDYPGDVQ